MPEWIKFVKEQVSTYSLEIVVFTVGCVGAAYTNSTSEHMLTKKQKFVSMMFGGITSLLLTPLLAELLNAVFDVSIHKNIYPGIGYIFGYLGLRSTVGIMLRYAERKKNRDK